MSLLKKIILNLGTVLTAMLAGAVIGAACGFGLGWLLSFGYERRGPSDPADAPVYVALGLGLYGGGLGAIVGLAGGAGLCAIVAARKTRRLTYLPPPPPNIEK